MPACGPFAAVTKNVAAVIVDEFMALSNVTETAAVVGMFVAPFAGLTALTIGEVTTTGAPPPPPPQPAQESKSKVSNMRRLIPEIPVLFMKIFPPFISLAEIDNDVRLFRFFP
jgi:hypothetical protein